MPKRGPADLRPRSARHEVENAVIVPGLGEIAHEALWLPEVHRLVVAIASPCGRSADRTGGAVRIYGLDVLAVAAQPDDDRRPERIRILDCKRSLLSVVSDADRRVDRPLLHGLRAGREHADRQFEIPVHCLARRPVLRLPVVEQARARRKAEHRQDALVGEPLAKAVLHEALILRGAGNFSDQAVHDPGNGIGAVGR